MLAVTSEGAEVATGHISGGEAKGMGIVPQLVSSCQEQAAERSSPVGACDRFMLAEDWGGVVHAAPHTKEER